MPADLPEDISLKLNPLRRDLGEGHPSGWRYLDMVPLTYGRWRVVRSDGELFYGEAY